MTSQKMSVLIPGCSSGMGEALCAAFHRKGRHVIAAAKSAESLDPLKSNVLESIVRCCQP